MSCNSFNVIYVLICSGCLEEYIGQTAVGKIRLRDGVRVRTQHIKQPEHQKLKVEEHVRICGTGFSHCKFPHKILSQSEEVVKTTEIVIEYNVTDTFSLFLNLTFLYIS